MSTWILQESGSYNHNVFSHAFTDSDRALVDEVLIFVRKDGEVEWIEIGDIRERTKPEEEAE